MTRTIQDILEEFKDIDCALSPECLSCDGELPMKEVAKRHRELTKQRIALVRELGREPTHNELWG